MNYKKIFVLATMAILLNPLLSYAWGPIGHKTIATIAGRTIKHRNIATIRELLNRQTLAMVSTWPEEMRLDPNFKKFENWAHLEADSQADLDPKSSKSEALKVFKQQCDNLGNKKTTQEQKTLALKWLIYIISELHQPLSIEKNNNSARPQEIKVSWYGKETNLYHVWNDLLIDSKKLSFSELTDLLMTQVNLKETEKLDYNPTKWIPEVIKVRNSIYKNVPHEMGPGWEDLYIFKNKDIVNQQLINGGLHLAKAIDHCIKSRIIRTESEEKEKQKGGMRLLYGG